jgi:hypothetical protein
MVVEYCAAITALDQKVEEVAREWNLRMDGEEWEEWGMPWLKWGQRSECIRRAKREGFFYGRFRIEGGGRSLWGRAGVGLLKLVAMPLDET